MTQNNAPLTKSSFKNDVLPLCIGEVAVVILVIIGAVIIHICGLRDLGNKFIGIGLGAILGAILTVVNYLVLIISIDRVINNYLTLRGEKEMSDEEAEEFTNANSAAVRKAIANSSTLRTISLVGILLLALLTGIFDPIAAAIPLLAYRPLLTIVELIKARKLPAPNPEKFIKYDDKDENEEKESD